MSGSRSHSSPGPTVQGPDSKRFRQSDPSSEESDSPETERRLALDSRRTARRDHSDDRFRGDNTLSDDDGGAADDRVVADYDMAHNEYNEDEGMDDDAGPRLQSVVVVAPGRDEDLEEE